MQTVRAKCDAEPNLLLQVALISRLYFCQWLIIAHKILAESQLTSLRAPYFENSLALGCSSAVVRMVFFIVKGLQGSKSSAAWQVAEILEQ